MLLDLPVPTVEDRDLDLDVRSVRVTNVVRCGDGFVVQAVGSFPGCSVEDAPATTRVDIELEPSAVGPLSREAARELARELDAVVARLEQWRVDGTPLRLLAAPGKHLALVDPDGAHVPLPRSA